jgi:PAS domain S-box-containing protein
LLDGLGLEIEEAHTGEEAVEKVRSKTFAVILLDVLMPGMSGFDTAKIIRHQDRSQHTPIIFVTASDIDRRQMERAYELGAVDFLGKPLIPIALQAKVRGLAELFIDKQQAKREAHQLRLMVQGTTDYAIFMLDPSGRVMTWNAGAERLKGYRADEIIGQHFSRFYPQEVIDRGWPAYELEMAQREGRFEDEGWRLRKDGSRFWANVVITALRDDEGHLAGFSKVTRDLTARKQAEEALRRSEERFRLLVEGAQDYAIFLLDSEGNIASWNPGAERIKGYRADEIIGQHFSRFYPQEANDCGWPAHELKVAAAEGRFEDEGWRVRKDGTQFWANVIITALRDEEGKLLGFSKITRDMTERKRSEENARRLVEESTARRVAEESAQLIQEQRERLRVTLESIGDAVISTDAEGRVEFLNPVAQKLVGWTNDAAHQRALGEVFQIVNETTRRPVENPAFRALSEGAVVGLANHTVLISKDGKECPIDDSAAPIRDAAGQIIGSVLVFRDITERKRNEAIVREQQEWWRVTLASIGDAVIATDTEARVTFLNPVAERLTGWSQVEAAGQPLDTVFPIANEQTGLPIENPVANVLRDGVTVGLGNHTILTAKDGTRWPIDDAAAPIRDGNGTLRGVVLTFRDVTEQRDAEAALRESEQKLRLLADTIPQLAWMARPDGYIFWYNRRWYEYTGTTPDQMEGWGWQAVHDPDVLPAVMERWQSSLATGQPFDMVFPLKGADGEFRPFLTRINPLRNEHGEITHWFGTNTDISEIKRMEQALRDNDRRKDEFLATLAHELRNPLAPIRNSLQILKMPRVDSDLVRKTRDVLDRQVDLLVRLVDDLLDVSRVMRGKIDLRRAPVEITSAIASAVEIAKPLIEVQGHTLDIAVPNESLLVDADPMRLAQVVGNLLTNSAKYTDAKGHIWLAASREGGWAVLSIRDSGIGIAPDMLPHIFELFVQADHASTKAQGGLGIGLTLVKSLVEMHGGTVEAHSAGLGKGSEFIVRLPLMAPDTQQANDHGIVESTQRAQPSGLRVLVADDNADAAFSFASLLELLGHNVQIAHDGSAAFELAVKFRPDVAFLDIGMPGMDGYEVARRLRSTPGLENVILAALTGWGQKEDRRRTAEAGFDHHLIKPPEAALIESLLAEVRARHNR